MYVSVFDLFKVGIGPSSSHTVGPMKAAQIFAQRLVDQGHLEKLGMVQAHLFGSLALTGKGHATDSAVIWGLAGEMPATAQSENLARILDRVQKEHRLPIGGTDHEIEFLPDRDIFFHYNEVLPQHPNGMKFVALDKNGLPLAMESAFSVGGGFVIFEGEDQAQTSTSPQVEILFPFTTAAELLEIGIREKKSIAAIVRENERAFRTDAEIDAGLDRIWEVMQSSIDRGCRTEGILPGGLNVKRRAASMCRTLMTSGPRPIDPLQSLDWVSLFALAVNEENAAGGQVVTAPTNGAAGVIPAVIAYYKRLLAGATQEGVRTFLLTAGAIGMLYKRNASLSAAEMGCQGEVGVACSMAAGGLAAVMGGSNEQIENAAEIGMEHNLGLTCDPIKGLVQVPCIERNTMGAAKAINAARLAVLHGDGTHRVSLDRVIETMRQTGVDMQVKYKETSIGGLAVNVVDC
ncbi:L-serine dehydratase 1 [Planctopirus limnophila DSM 3776]|uniref:L-serine dehydratase n=1 Tax=Planctopirus limnophila (strain ATCC 43296 / DSM 3776 / IFAM 1008 / Mu 290) TaxID=521674 RepID=D5SN42_PLAL2|nr:L-serine dehydratase 1 [Planctopirus limnophila DSM 3776]